MVALPVVADKGYSLTQAVAHVLPVLVLAVAIPAVPRELCARQVHQVVLVKDAAVQGVVDIEAPILDPHLLGRSSKHLVFMAARRHRKKPAELVGARGQRSDLPRMHAVPWPT